MPQRASTTNWRHVLVLGYLALIAFFSMELVAGWEPLELQWPIDRYYLFLAVSGLIVGGLMSERYWLPGLITGPLIGLGGLATVAWHMTTIPSTNSVFVFMVAMIGTIPGWALFVALRLWQASVTETTEEAANSQSLRPAR